MFCLFSNNRTTIKSIALVTAISACHVTTVAAAATYQLHQYTPGITSSATNGTTQNVAPTSPSAVGDGVSKAGACASGATGCATWAGNLATVSRVLSNDGLTVYSSNAGMTTTASIGKSSGKWYFELTTPAQGITIGLCRADLGVFNPTEPNCYGGDGYWWYSSGSSSRTYFSWTGTATLGIQLDLDSHTAIFLKDNVPFKSVALPVGNWTPAITGSTYQAPTVFPVQGNFGQMAFKYPVPAGYNAGLW